MKQILELEMDQSRLLIPEEIRGYKDIRVQYRPFYAEHHGREGILQGYHFLRLRYDAAGN